MSKVLYYPIFFHMYSGFRLFSSATQQKRGILPLYAILKINIM
ncbi:hypothetical protein CLOLEP_03107 [[Clostridium] leptum DSM 753]|uniref:Uncharacterized protein n=1 Tax=[Clostridium] leptum DSM 753 TaxID=428125 RepID=A7VWY3_9FIRM|nr:hypothetical protein CLOLEP_03107 [[Clostridium] leptum DSM 753]